MSLWNKTDNLVGAPKFIARKAWFNAASATVVSAANDTISLVNSNTGFNTGDEVMYSINGGTVIAGLTNATAYFVRVVGPGLIELYTTYAQSIAAPATTGILNITGVGAGNHTLQRTGKENPFAGESGIYFVDQTEAQVKTNKDKGFNGAGWWLYKTYTDGNSTTRHKAECLVAMTVPAGTSGDAEDVVLKDVGIVITTQPADVLDFAVPEAGASFSVVADTEPTTGGALTYQWQLSINDGVDWNNTANGSGGTTDTYTTVNVDSGMDNYQYRCIISSAGAVNATTRAALLTVAL